MFEVTHEDSQAMISVHKCIEEKQKQGKKTIQVKTKFEHKNKCKVTIGTFRLILKGIE